MKRSFILFVLAWVFGACTTEADLGNHDKGVGGATGSGGNEGKVSLVTCNPHSLHANEDCPDGECIEGLCLIASATTCHPSDDGNDDCDDHSVCRLGKEGNRCYPLPDCPDNGVCPVPDEQAPITCNQGEVASKSRVCIPGRCLNNSDCIHDSPTCIRSEATDVLGTCHYGPIGLGHSGDGAAWEEVNGCAVTPTRLIGHKPEGATCSDPKECEPVCCSCGGGTGAILAAKCDLSPSDPLTGTCASAAEACSAAFYQGDYGSCAAP